MSDADALDRRLSAVERALTEEESDLTDLRDAAELTREVERLAARLDAAEQRLDELDAATQALRGYVGNVRTVNQSVERRADAALAKAESLEAALDGDRADGDEAHPEEERACAARDRDVDSRRSFGDGRTETDFPRNDTDESDPEADAGGLLWVLARQSLNHARRKRLALERRKRGQLRSIEIEHAITSFDKAASGSAPHTHGDKTSSPAAAVT